MDPFELEFIAVNHSIADAVAIAVTTRAGTIIHTGDFKVDMTPIMGDPINLTRLGELGRKGVLALLSDSTNAERPGPVHCRSAMSARPSTSMFRNTPTSASSSPPSRPTSTACSR